MANIPVNFGGTFLSASQTITGFFGGLISLGTGSVVTPTGSTINYLEYNVGIAGDGTSIKDFSPTTLITTASITVSSASLAPFITPTGSFSVNGITINITGSTVPPNSSTTIFLASGSTPANTVTAIVTAFNVSKSIAPYSTALQYITSSVSASTGIFFQTTTSLPGLMGNTYYIISGSTTTNFSGGNNTPAFTLAPGATLPLSITALGLSADSAPVFLYS